MRQAGGALWALDSVSPPLALLLILLLWLLICVIQLQANSRGRLRGDSRVDPISFQISVL